MEGRQIRSRRVADGVLFRCLESLKKIGKVLRERGWWRAVYLEATDNCRIGVHHSYPVGRGLDSHWRDASRAVAQC